MRQGYDAERCYRRGMIPIVRPRIFWLAFGLTVYGVLGGIAAVRLLAFGGSQEPASIVLVVIGFSAWGIGALGAALAVRVALGGTRLPRLWLAIAMTVGAVSWAIAFDAFVSLHNWSTTEFAVYCPEGCGPYPYEIRLYIAIAVASAALLASAITVALAARQLSTRERVRIGAAVLVSSIPFLNLAIFVERIPPLPDMTPREHRQ